MGAAILASHEVTNKAKHTIGLHKMAQFALFVTSYTPLFLLIIGKQLSDHWVWLHFGGFNCPALGAWFTKFGLSTLLMLVMAFGLFGYFVTIRNVEEAAENGDPVTITRINNKSGESIGYIATYIVPFMFQGFDSLFVTFAVLLILLLIYRIYVNSPLLLVNPILSITHGLYEIEFTNGKNQRVGYVIMRNKFLDEDDLIKLYPIGHRLYYAKPEG